MNETVAISPPARRLERLVVPRRLARLRRHGWFLLLVALPVVVTSVYYGFIASDRYVSESRFVVKSVAQRPSQISTLANLIQTTGLSAGQEQTNEVIDYIRSRNALTDLLKQIDVRAMFAPREADLLSRYPQPFKEDRFENLYRYYDGMVSAKIDPNTALAVLSVEAFTPQDAAKINERLLGLSEDIVNRLNAKARDNAISEDVRQVAVAQQRVKNARLALAAYRNQSDLLDPAKQAAAVFEVATKLISQQAALRAQLDLMRQVAPANPTIPSLQSRIAALSVQISAQNGRAVGSNSAISSKLTGYDAVVLEQEFASQMLTLSSTQLAQARADAVRQQFYLERVVSANTPDVASVPHRFLRVLTVTGVLLCLYFIGWMLIVGILEHSPED